MVCEISDYDAAKLQPFRDWLVTHSGRSVVLLGKFQGYRRKLQIPGFKFHLMNTTKRKFLFLKFKSWNLGHEFF